MTAGIVKNKKIRWYTLNKNKVLYFDIWCVALKKLNLQVKYLQTFTLVTCLPGTILGRKSFDKLVKKHENKPKATLFITF